jgi:hypothetical protein
MSSVAARFFQPQISGIAPRLMGRVGTESFASTMTRNLIRRPICNTSLESGPWFSFTSRFNSGLLAGPVPCAGGNCGNGPNGTDTVVHVSGLTPDKQFEAGRFCRSVRATPLSPISPTGLCPASQYGSNLVKIPAPGTEDDDHNPPRIAQRNLFDVAVRHDNLFRGDKYKWSARLEIINLTN